METELKELVVKTKEYCKIVIKETKQLQQMVTDQGKEITQKEVLLAAKSIALSTSKLTDNIEAVNNVNTNNENILLHKELLMSSSQDVRDNVLQFLKCSKEVFDNPYDYLTSQNLNASFQELSNSISNTVSSICMFRIIILKELTGSKGVESSKTTNPTNEKQTKETDNIVEAAKELASSIKMILAQAKNPQITPEKNQATNFIPKNIKIIIFFFNFFFSTKGSLG